jgi:hypothetical protein
MGVTYKKKVFTTESNKRIEPSLVKLGLFTFEKSN